MTVPPTSKEEVNCKDRDRIKQTLSSWRGPFAALFSRRLMMINLAALPPSTSRPDDKRSRVQEAMELLAEPPVILDTYG
jgi:hypothetical protein